MRLEFKLMENKDRNFDLLIFSSVTFGILVVYNKNQTKPLVKVITTEKVLQQVYETCVKKKTQILSSSSYDDLENSQEWLPMPKEYLDGFYMDIMLYTNKKIYTYKKYTIIDECNDSQNRIDEIKHILPSDAKITYFNSLDEYKQKESPIYRFETYTLKKYLRNNELIIYLTDRYTKKDLRKIRLFSFLHDRLTLCSSVAIYKIESSKTLYSKLQSKITGLNNNKTHEEIFTQKYRELFSKLYDYQKDDFSLKVRENYNKCPYCKSECYSIVYEKASYASSEYTLTCLHCTRVLLDEGNRTFDGGMWSENDVCYGKKLYNFSLC